MNKKWFFPLNMKLVGTTTDSMSFLYIDITREVEIPLVVSIGLGVGAYFLFQKLEEDGKDFWRT